jgi:hypothetical protein
VNAPPPPLLAYANPTVFFDGVYRSRSWNGVIAVVALGAFGAALTKAGSALNVSTRNEVGWWLKYALLAAGVGCLVGMAVQLVGMALGWETRIRVTDHGISRGRVLWPWVRMARFGGLRCTGASPSSSTSAAGDTSAESSSRRPR